MSSEIKPLTLLKGEIMMASNEQLVKEYIDGQVNYTPSIPKKNAEIIPLPLKKKKTKTKSAVLPWTKSEKILVALVSFFVLAMCVLTIYTSNSLTQINRSLQDVNVKITETEIANENLEQNVQELSQYERVHEIAQKYGLELNDENVRNILK